MKHATLPLTVSLAPVMEVRVLVCMIGGKKQNAEGYGHISTVIRDHGYA